ncbi:hypothetical protein Pmani_020076 [Petrolisthes manimaculis]|uniref:Uncharacterized protein n=1 Tax=Petrolisthes manimaculis TaxID=1843537 RepID=A0AAE1PH10_9EUCA|nr:hypothetical protein Pmani_020076 [Petrolisthes manimaculis]
MVAGLRRGSVWLGRQDEEDRTWEEASKKEVAELRGSCIEVMMSWQVGCLEAVMLPSSWDAESDSAVLA